MKVRVILRYYTPCDAVIGNNAYAIINGDGFSMDVLLSPGHGAWDSLRESAVEAKKEAERLSIRADRMLEAASILENQHNAALDKRMNETNN